MEKVKQFLLSTNFTMVVFVLIGLRIAATGASIGDALAVFAICGLQGWNMYVDKIKKDDINATVAKEINDIKSHMSALMIKNSTRPTVAPSNTEAQPKRFF